MSAQDSFDIFLSQLRPAPAPDWLIKQARLAGQAVDAAHTVNDMTAALNANAIGQQAPNLLAPLQNSPQAYAHPMMLPMSDSPPHFGMMLPMSQSPPNSFGGMVEQTQNPPFLVGPTIEQGPLLPGTIPPLGTPVQMAGYMANIPLDTGSPGWFANITLGGEKVVSPDGPITVHGEITVEPNCLPCYYDGIITVVQNFEIIYTGDIPTQETTGGKIDWDILKELGNRDLEPGDEILVTINFFCTGNGKGCKNSTTTYSIFVSVHPLASAA